MKSVAGTRLNEILEKNWELDILLNRLSYTFIPEIWLHILPKEAARHPGYNRLKVKITEVNGKYNEYIKFHILDPPRNVIRDVELI